MKKNKNAAKQAKNNAKQLADAFLLLGLTVETYEENPHWIDKAKNTPKTVSVVALPEILDGDGEPYEFMFSHDTGQIIINNLY